MQPAAIASNIDFGFPSYKVVVQKNLYFGRTDETFMSHARSNYNDQWVHIAIVRDNSGGTLRWFRNGVQVATYSGSAWNWDMNSSADLYFGLFPGSTSSRRNGIRFDDFRITVGVARYTSNFTPPGLLPQYKQDTTTLGTRSNPATNAEQIRTSASNALAISDKVLREDLQELGWAKSTGNNIFLYMFFTNCPIITI